MKYLKYILLTIVLFLCSCKSVIGVSDPLKTVPDTINKPTNTVVAKDTTAELPKGSWVKTDSDEKTEVLLEEDTVAFIKPEKTTDVSHELPQKPVEIILPKNTEIILPQNTYLQTSSPAKVNIEASTEVILPQGTEITITRINWYAILFYGILVFGIAWYYLQGKNEDKNNDGFVDEKKDSE